MNGWSPDIVLLVRPDWFRRVVAAQAIINSARLNLERRSHTLKRSPQAKRFESERSRRHGPLPRVRNTRGWS
nr:MULTISPECIES: hypothetical protein [unclassified Burkholderia]